MKENVLLTAAYLPPVSYFSKLYHARKVWIEVHDHYVKQTFRNRCTIGPVDGPLSLTIPTEKTDSLKCPMHEIRISEHGNWRHVHQHAFISAYKQSPFFDYYADEFFALLQNLNPSLLHFNLSLLQWVCVQIDLETDWQLTETYLSPDTLPSDWEDWREKIHPKLDFRLADPHFVVHPYYQVSQHKHPFMPNLSIVDLLFNMGPESILVLRDSYR